MQRFAYAVSLLTSSILLLMTPTVAWAQDSTVNSGLNVITVLSTVIYGIIGIALCVVGYFAFDRLAGLNLRRELVEDQNLAIGVMLAGAFIGIAIVVASVMLS